MFYILFRQYIFMKYILRVKARIIFLNETPVFVFAELAIFHSI